MPMNEVDKYLSSINSKQKTELERIRKIIHKTIPEAEEVISYGMPVYKYNKKYLIGMAAFNNHMSVFPGSGPIESIKSKLKDYKISKGTIQFTLDKPIPDNLIKQIIEYRIKEIEDSA